MLRLYIEETLTAQGRVHLDAKQSHYALHVLRLGAGEPMLAFNENDGEWEGIFGIGSKRICFFLPSQKKCDPLILPRLGLAFAPLKTERLGFLLEKATELGVTDLFPLQTDRTQHVRLNRDKIRDQLISAAQQCERFDIPLLYPLQSLPETLERLVPTWTVIVAMERQTGSCPHDLAQKEESAQGERYCLFVGPEGGWSEREKELFHARQIPYLSLGPLVLRAETAAVAGIVCLTSRGNSQFDGLSHDI